MPGIAVGILAVLALLVGSFLYVWHRRQWDDNGSVIGGVGFSVTGDLSIVLTVSGPTEIGSLVVELGLMGSLCLSPHCGIVSSYVPPPACRLIHGGDE